MAEVKLHGFWYSFCIWRVVWTLKLKGIPYENIEEDRFNKCPQLLQYNPVHKQTLMLVHAGKLICKSMVNVEYIDEIWPQNPLLPTDPYKRTQIPTIGALFHSSGGEELKKGKENLWEHLGVVEEQCFGYKNKFFGGDTINIVDIAFGSIAKFIEIVEDIIQVKVLEAKKLPRLHSWFNNSKDVPVISENLPEQRKMVAFIKSLIQKSLASS